MELWQSMNSFLDPLVNPSSLQDRLLGILILSILFLLFLSLFFTFLTFLFRFRNNRHERIRNQLQSRWKETLLDVLAGDASEEELHNQVQPQDSLYFIDFLLKHARILRGEEYQLIQRLAKPYLPVLKQRLHSRDVERDALIRVVRPFLENQQTVAAGGIIRIVNDCEIKAGMVTKINLPTNLLARFQVLEYLRAFLTGRVGWYAIRSIMIISGAFGLFKRSVVVDAGGYYTDSASPSLSLLSRSKKSLFNAIPSFVI